jgi:hypothetical protein
MTYSLFHVIAHDEQGDAIKRRKVVVAATQRLDSRYSAWLQAPGFDERFAYIADEARDIVSATIQEFEAAMDPIEVLAAYREARKPIESQSKEASTHEARKPRMCPFHKDVVDISLAQGDPKSGFEAMAQHWGVPRHCEGEGYKGESCNFKPQMATQSYWDERAEKNQQKREEKERQLAEEEAAQQAQEDALEEQAEAPDVPVEAPAEGENSDVERYEGEGGAYSEAPVAEPELMSMAASTHQATPTTGLGGPSPKMDKRKWTPNNVRKLDADDSDGRWPTRTKDIIDPIVADNSKPLTAIGEATTERQEVTRDGGPGKTDQTSLGPRTGPATAVK